MNKSNSIQKLITKYKIKIIIKYYLKKNNYFFIPIQITIK
jgi:hypothetical protein